MNTERILKKRTKSSQEKERVTSDRKHEKVFKSMIKLKRGTEESKGRCHHKLGMGRNLLVKNDYDLLLT